MPKVPSVLTDSGIVCRVKHIGVSRSRRAPAPLSRRGKAQPATCCFAGLTAEQAAAAPRISLRTANRHWTYAKACLYRHMSERDCTGT